MLRRFLIFGSLAVLLCAVVMVVLAAKSTEGLASALAIWGFVLTALGVVLGIAGLRAVRTADNPEPNTQVIKSNSGDAIGVQNGTMNVNRPSSPKANQRDNK